jgi:CelD/BcsL family acetyltransferase involved in cellulose biosynthesis
MKWKFDRYRRQGCPDVFGIPWARELVERIHATRTPRFGGLLSTLHVGDDLAAAWMGIRSHSVWHCWFTAYNPTFARYSPGVILLLKMAQEAAALGLRSIDLGDDQLLYKRGLTNRTVILAEGTVERPSLTAAARRIRRSGATLIRRSAWLYPPARVAARALRRVKTVLS